MTDQSISPMPEQRDVIEAEPGTPTKVVAGAGTGKTMTMVWRFAYLVERYRFDPKRIMAVTFTNKAAGELRERTVKELIARRLIDGPAAMDGAWIGTFHGLAYRLLRENCYEIGFDRDIKIIDQLETALMIQSVQRALRDDELVDAEILKLEAITPDRAMKLSAEMFSLISRVRGLGISPAELRRLIDETIDRLSGPPDEASKTDWALECFAHREAAKMFLAAYVEYESRLRRQNLLDHDGVMIAARDALRVKHALRDRSSAYFQHIIVDEFQDTNRVQLDFLRALARPGATNLEVVGDPRQSIYGWRDADIKNILDFPVNFGVPVGSPSIVFPLDRNRRSDQTILDAAGAILTPEPGPAGARLVSEPYRKSADAFQLFLAETPAQEAALISACMIAFHDQGNRWDEMAILTRSGSPPVAFETELRKRGIPYVTGGGQGFFNRQEIKDVLAYLRAVNDPLDTMAMIRLLQGPAVRVPDSAMYQIRRRAVRGLRQSMWDLVIQSEREGFPELDGKTRIRVESALELVREAMLAKAGMSMGELLQYVLDRSRYVELAASDQAEAQRRMANIRKLTRMAADFEARQVFSGLDDFIRYVELHDDLNVRTAEADVAGVEAVRFMTIHSAKGLEFPIVFLAHLRPLKSSEQGTLLFDEHYGLVLKYLDEPGKDEETIKYRDWAAHATTPKQLREQEERRVIYVALTRARNHLIVTASRKGQPGWADVLAGAEKGCKPEFDYFRDLVTHVSSNPGSGLLLPPALVPATGRAQAGSPLGDPPNEPTLPRAVPAKVRRVASIPPLQLSPSGIVAFAQCQLRYRYLFEWRLPGLPDGIWPVEDMDEANRVGVPADVRGTLVHALLQWAHSQVGSFPSQADTERRWESIATGVIAPSQAASEWSAKIGPMMARYRQLDVARYETLVLEQPFHLVVEVDGREAIIDGRIDRVCRSPGGRIILLDYKTTSDIDSTISEEYRRQLAVYQLAAREIFGWEADPVLIDLPHGRVIASGSLNPRETVEGFIRQIAAPERVAPVNPPCWTCGYRLSCPSSMIRKDRRSSVPEP